MVNYVVKFNQGNMKKKLLILSFMFSVFVLAMVSTSIILDNQNENMNNFGLSLINAEAIASSSEGGSGITLFRVCSRKSGDVLCSARRGNRKWAINVNLRFGVAGGVVCPECPDQDFDYE